MQHLTYSVALLTVLLCCNSNPSLAQRASVPCPTQGVTMDEALLHATDTLIDAYYNATTGLFATTGWWNSASALYGLAVAARLHPSINATRVLSLLSNTYAMNQATFLNGNPGAEAWWGLCWVAASDLAYDLHQPELGASFLDLANALGKSLMSNYGDAYSCPFVPPASSANSDVMTSAASASLAGQLVLRTGSTGPEQMRRYLYFWMSYLAAPYGAFSNYSSFCTTTFGPQWTCNQGLFLTLLTDHNLLAGSFDKMLLAAKRSVASMSNFSNNNGILVESCEPDCNSNETQYKGMYIRSLLYLWTVLRNWRSVNSDRHPSVRFVNETLSNIRSFVLTNAASLLRQSCEVLPIEQLDGGDAKGWFFGQEWSGPFDGEGVGRQTSAFELLLAAAVTNRPE